MVNQTDLIPAYFVGCILSGMIGGSLAAARGRNPVVWGLASCIVLVPALLCLACLPRLCQDCRCQLQYKKRLCDRCAAHSDPNAPPLLSRWIGVIVLMLTLFAFALMIGLGSILDWSYWGMLRGLIVLGAMVLFLAFWGLMLRWRQWKTTALRHAGKTTEQA